MTTRTFLMAALVKTLQQLGGEAHVQQLDYRIAEEWSQHFDGPLDERRYSALRMTLSFIRTELKDAGVIKATRNGWWTLSQAAVPFARLADSALSTISRSAVLPPRKEVEYLPVQGTPAIQIDYSGPPTLAATAAVCQGLQRIADRVAMQVLRDLDIPPEQWLPSGVGLVRLEFDQLAVGSIRGRIVVHVRSTLQLVDRRSFVTSVASAVVTAMAIGAPLALVNVVRSTVSPEASSCDVSPELRDMVLELRQAASHGTITIATTVTADGACDVSISLDHEDGASPRR